MAADNYQIAGGLNFGGVPAQNDYMGAYRNALSLNSQNYSNILSGYQGTLAAQQGPQEQIQQGYGNLSGQVMGDISGIDASQRQAIADQYAQSSGSAAQGLISRGLGNTTVADSVQRGLQLDKSKADVALSNQMAQLTAGYRSQLGLAGLNYANQANMQNAAQRNQQLGFMERVNAPYPNAKNYADASLQSQTLAMARQGMNRGAGGGGGGLGGGGGGAAGMSRGGISGLGGFNGGGASNNLQQGVGGYGLAAGGGGSGQKGEYGIVRDPGVATVENPGGGAGGTNFVNTSSGGNGGNDPNFANDPTIGSNPAGDAGQAGWTDPYAGNQAGDWGGGGDGSQMAADWGGGGGGSGGQSIWGGGSGGDWGDGGGGNWNGGGEDMSGGDW